MHELVVTLRIDATRFLDGLAHTRAAFLNFAAAAEQYPTTRKQWRTRRIVAMLNRVIHDE